VKGISHLERSFNSIYQFL